MTSRLPTMVVVATDGGQAAAAEPPFASVQVAYPEHAAGPIMADAVVLGPVDQHSQLKKGISPGKGVSMGFGTPQSAKY